MGVKLHWWSILFSLFVGKVSKYGVISGLDFPVFGLNTGRYGPETTPYVHTFHAVFICGSVRSRRFEGLMANG